jgi:hypothetical protein
MALAAGMRELSIPRIAYGPDLVKMLAPEGFAAGKGTSCCGSTISVSSLKNPGTLIREAAEAVASIKLHGRK